MPVRPRASRSRARSSPEDAQGRSLDASRSRTPVGVDMEDDEAGSDVSEDLVAPTDCDLGDPASLASFLSQTLAVQGQRTNRKQSKALERSFATQSKAFDGRLLKHATEIDVLSVNSWRNMRNRVKFLSRRLRTRCLQQQKKSERKMQKPSARWKRKCPVLARRPRRQLPGVHLVAHQECTLLPM